MTEAAQVSETGATSGVGGEVAPLSDGVVSPEEAPANPANVGEVGEAEAEPSGSGDVTLEELSAEQISMLEELLPRYRKTLKVNGEEKELGFGDIEKDYSKWLGAQSKFEEAANMRKETETIKEQNALMQQQFEQFFTALKTNPAAVLEDPNVLGEKAWDVLEDAMSKRLQRNMMSPEERDNFDKLREYEELKKFKEEQTRHQETQRAKALQDRYMEEYDVMISEALSKENIPKTPYTVARFAQVLNAAVQKGVEADPKEVAEIVAEDYKKDFRSVLGGLSEADLHSYLGEDVAKKLRASDLARIKKPAPDAPVKSHGKAGGSRKPQKMTMDEFIAKNRETLARLGD